MTITVSKVPTKPKAKKPRSFRPRVNIEKTTRRNVFHSFRDIGYRMRQADGKYIFDSEFSDLPSLTFANVFEARGWLEKSGFYKEV